MKKIFTTLALVAIAGSSLFAQFRATDKTGINVFETPKEDTKVEFNGVKVNFGGGFTQGFQALSHSNKAISIINPDGVDVNRLIPIRPGFNLAAANLVINTHLADGVALKMELYLASRHHNETWVKGGYMQFDKIPFLDVDFLNNIMEYTTLKVGQMEVNYGDAHFRRTDGGNAIYNPFVENNIIDAFATEIGVEADIQKNGFVGVLSVTNGLLKGNVVDLDPTYADPNDKSTLISKGKNNPTIIAKLGYDSQLNSQLRVRATGSVYHNPGAADNTLLSGDRTGSNYFGVMHYATPGTSNFTNGRFTPGFTDKITGLMGNLFVKYNGLEWFTTLESLSGRSRLESTGSRNASQIATDLVYRFGKNENFWVGAKYNRANSQMYLANDLPAVDASGNLPAFEASQKGMYDINIDRLAFSAGWFITKNVMTKVEYVNQTYNGFKYNHINSDGKFNGLVVQAVVGF